MGWDNKLLLYIYVHIHVYSACYIRVSMRIKKEARQVKEKFFEFKEGEYSDRQRA